MRPYRSSRQELSEIEELHRRDRAAVESGDFNKLRTLVDEEAVILAPGKRAERGAAELNAALSGLTDVPQTHQVLKYDVEYEEVLLLGAEHATEWGSIHRTIREIATGKTVLEQFHFLRVLRKRGAGPWKVYRSIWSPANERAAPEK